MMNGTESTEQMLVVNLQSIYYDFKQTSMFIQLNVLLQ